MPDTRHPLKKQLFDYNIRLCDVALIIGKTPGWVSQVLNGRIRMPADLERKIQAIIDEVRQDQQIAVER